MKKVFTAWSIFFLISFPVLGSSTSLSVLPKELSDAIKLTGFNQKGLGLYIHNVNTDTPIVSFQAKQFLNPASVIKLVTTSAALDLLGTGYRWKTEVKYSGTIEHGTLNGNLYLRGNGDPYLTPERLWLLLNRISIYGIKNINGNVVFDDSYFKPDPVDYSAFDEQPYRSYNVGPNAVLLGFQATEFHFAVDNNGTKPKVRISPFPASPKMQIVNKMALTDGPCGRWQKRLSLKTRTETDTLMVIFNGHYSKKCDRRTLYRRVMETQNHFKHFFLPLWQQLGGSVSGTVIQGHMPVSSKKVIKEKSISLAEAVRLINKFSNNVMTQQVLLTLGAHIFGEPGTKKKGLIAIRQWLTKNKLNHPALRLDNGAGLSRNTRISAELLGRLLHYNFKQAYMPEFITSLPVSGYDGTMKHRFKNKPLIGRAHMKTGLLDFVQTMAGYITSDSGKRYVVVLLHNHPRAHTKDGERLQNRIIHWVYDQ